MNKYTLYLDESEVCDNNGNRYFVIGGIIIKNTYHKNKIIPKVEALKKKIWENDINYTSHILHELEINRVFKGDITNAKTYNLIFKNNEKKYKQIYNGIYHIVNCHEAKDLVASCFYDFVTYHLHRRKFGKFLPYNDLYCTFVSCIFYMLEESLIFA